MKQGGKKKRGIVGRKDKKRCEYFQSIARHFFTLLFSNSYKKSGPERIVPTTVNIALIIRIEWEKQRLVLQGGQTDPLIVQQGIDKCKRSLIQVHSIARAETD